MEGAQRDRLISFVSGNTIEIDEFFRSDKVFCDFRLDLLELGI